MIPTNFLFINTFRFKYHFTAFMRKPWQYIHGK